MKRSKTLKDLLPILCIDETTGCIVSKNADITAAFELQSPEIFAVSDGEYDTLHDVLVRAAKVLPVGYMVHKQDLFIEPGRRSGRICTTIRERFPSKCEQFSVGK
ncbi:MAG: DUF3875 domain-containing protein [Rudanella sp.]|nr:DUF3875 domain-containing protein [Rudanella sp.]